MASLSSSSTEELLLELQGRLGAGVFAAASPEDSDENLYTWWGPRLLALGLTARLTHSLNLELESSAGDFESIEPTDDEEDPESSPAYGVYL